MRHAEKNASLLAVMLIIGGICQLLIFFTVHHRAPDRIFSPDSPSYVNPARAILRTSRFAVSSEKPDIPEARRTPGYPAFIASIFFLFGEDYVPLIIAQILLNLGTTLISYRTVSLIWDSETALIAALLLLFDPSLFISSQRVMAESLFTFVLSVAILVMVHALKKQQHQMFLFFLHSTCLAIATLIRPITYYFIIPLIGILVLILRSHQNLSWKRTRLAIIVLLIPQIILIGGWKIRNYRVTGKAEFSYIQGINLLFYSCSGVIAERDGISFEEARHGLGYSRYAELHPETQDWSIAQLDTRWKREGRDIIRQYPLWFLKSHLRGIGKMMFSLGESSLIKYVGDEPIETGPIGELFQLSWKDYIQKWGGEKFHLFLLAFLMVTYLLFMYMSMTYSFWFLLKSKDACWGVHLFMTVLTLYFIAVSGGPAASSRFRVPLMPVFCMYAGHGLMCMIERLKRGRDEREANRFNASAVRRRC